MSTSFKLTMHNYSRPTNEHTINQNNKKCSDLGIHKKENDLFITEHHMS